jgi:hypothetical protein
MDNSFNPFVFVVASVVSLINLSRYFTYLLFSWAIIKFVFVSDALCSNSARFWRVKVLWVCYSVLSLAMCPCCCNELICNTWSSFLWQVVLLIANLYNTHHFLLLVVLIDLILFSVSYNLSLAFPVLFFFLLFLLISI